MKIGTFIQHEERRLFFQLGDKALDRQAIDNRPEFRDSITFIAAGNAAVDAAKAAADAQSDRALHPLSDLSIAPPILPTTVLCSGSNYRSHNEEKAAFPLSGREPEFFLETSDCVIGPGDGIIHDPRMSEKIDCETELAIVIGRPGRHIPKEDAVNHIFGYMVANDITARGRQVRKTAEGVVFYELGRGKAFDGSLPLCQVITTTEEITGPPKPPAYDKDQRRTATERINRGDDLDMCGSGPLFFRKFHPSPRHGHPDRHAGGHSLVGRCGTRGILDAWTRTRPSQPLLLARRHRDQRDRGYRAAQ